MTHLDTQKSKFSGFGIVHLLRRPTILFMSGAMQTPSVLLVDDDLDWIEMFRTVFPHSVPGSRLYIATSGETALRKLREGLIPRPYVVVLDLKMPGMGGIEVLAKLRANAEHKDDPIYVWSASDDPEDIQEARRLGVSGYLVKPKSLDELKEMQRYLASSEEGEPRAFRAARSGGLVVQCPDVLRQLD